MGKPTGSIEAGRNWRHAGQLLADRSENPSSMSGALNHPREGEAAIWRMTSERVPNREGGEVVGYMSTVRGAIVFDPPMTHEEVESMYDIDEDCLFRFRVFETETPVTGGLLKSKGCCVIEPRWEDEVKAYTVKDDLAGLVDFLPGRTFTGEFRIEGEENGDIRRVFVDESGTVVEWYPAITWPDGTEEHR